MRLTLISLLTPSSSRQEYIAKAAYALEKSQEFHSKSRRDIRASLAESHRLSPDIFREMAL